MRCGSCGLHVFEVKPDTWCTVQVLSFRFFFFFSGGGMCVCGGGGVRLAVAAKRF